MKLKKISAAFALVGAVALGSNNLFASTLQIVNTGEPNKYIGLGGGTPNHSNYSYYFDDLGQVYCFFPGQTVRNGFEYSYNSFMNRPDVYYALTQTGDTQLKQAALWTLAGGQVQPQAGNMDELNNYLAYVTSLANAFTSEKFTLNNINLTLHYDPILNAYVSEGFKTRNDDVIEMNINSIDAYFQDSSNNNIGTRINKVAGTYRVVVPVDSIQSLTTEIRLSVIERGALGAFVYTSNSTSQEMIFEFKDAGTAYQKNLNPLVFRKGDINKDGVVGEDDARQVLAIFANKVAQKPSDLTFADMDNNGKLDQKDAKIILQIGDYQLGDVNMDKQINATDAAKVLDLFKNNNATTKEIILGDMTGDGLLNSTDAALILDLFKNS